MILALLCLGAVAATSLVTSVLIGVAWSAGVRWRARLSARTEARLLLAAALTPGLLGLAALGVALVPSLGWLPDHCLEHAPHHPHLCVRHATGSLTLPLLALAGATAGRWLWAWAHAVRNLLRVGTTRRALEAAARKNQDLYILPTQAPEAFVMGFLGPRVYVSEGLLDMPAEVVEAVLAHERAHARRRDPLRSWLAAIALAGHLPGLASWLGRQLRRAQEMAADAQAAAVLADAPQVAGALVRLARMRTSHPEPALTFAGGHIEERVHRLLAPQPSSERPTGAAIGVLALALLLGMLACAGPVHHALETFLGILS